MRGRERPKSFVYPLQQGKISPQQSGHRFQPSPIGITSTEAELCDSLPGQLFPLWNEELNVPAHEVPTKHQQTPSMLTYQQKSQELFLYFPYTQNNWHFTGYKTNYP